MIIELLSILGILIGGLLIVHSLGVRGWSTPALGFITGIAFYTTIGFLHIILSIPLSPPFIILLVVLLPLLIWLLRFRHRPFSINTGLMLLTLAIVSLLVFLFREVHLFKWSTDSFAYIQSSSLFVQGEYDQTSMHSFIARLLSVPLLHAPAQIVGQYYLASITPLIGISGLVSLSWLIKEGSRKLLSKEIANFGALLGVALLLTNNRYIFNSFYLNGHMLFAVLLLLIVGFGWLLFTRTSTLSFKSLVILQAILIPALVVTRPEASLVVALAILPTLFTKHVPWRLRSIPLLSLGVSTIAWQGFLAFEQINDSSQLNIQIVGMLAFGMFVLFAIPLLRSTWLMLHGSKVLLSIEIVIWGLLGILAFREQNLFIRSTTSTVQNLLFDKGAWGLSFMLLVAIGLLIAWYRKSTQPIHIRFPITTFIPLMFVLAHLRDGAYRVGPGDSLNRMLVHILPVIVLYVIVMSISKIKYSQRPQVQK